MKYRFVTISRRLLAVLSMLFFLLSCSKDKETPDLDGGGGKLTFNVNGTLQTYTFTTLSTFYEEAVEDGEEYFSVIAGGSKVSLQADEYTDTESIIFNITLPVAKFRNPRGTYGIGDYDFHPVQIILYQFNSEQELSAYASYLSDTDGKKMGEVSITDFEIGQQKFLMQDIGGEGYLELAGKFSVDLHHVVSVNEEGAVEEGQLPVIKVVDGEFRFKQLTSLLDMFK